MSVAFGIWKRAAMSAVLPGNGIELVEWHVKSKEEVTHIPSGR